MLRRREFLIAASALLVGKQEAGAVSPYLLMGGLQPEVSAFVRNVAGAVSPITVRALNTFVTAGKGAGWWQRLIEVYPFCGNSLSSSLVKLKTQTGGTTSLVNNNFVSGDYSQASGFGNASANANKYLQTGVNLNSLGLSNTNLSFGMFIINGVNIGANSGYIIGDSPGSGDSILFSSSGAIGITSAANASLGTSSSGVGARIFSADASHYFNAQSGVLQDRSTSTLGSFTSNTEVFLFRRTSSGSGFYAQAKVGLTFFGNSLSESQAVSLGQAILTFERSVRSISLWNSLPWAWVGDSITYGTLATNGVNQFSNLVSAARGALEFNFGVPNSQTTTDATGGGTWALSLLTRYPYILSLNFAKVFVMIGTNDQAADVTTNGNAALIATYQTNLTTILTAFAGRYGSGNVFVISPQWSSSNNSTKNGAWNTGMSAAASAAGVTFIDYYTVLQAQGTPANFEANAQHPNNAGMTLIATTIEGAV